MFLIAWHTHAMEGSKAQNLLEIIQEIHKNIILDKKEIEKIENDIEEETIKLKKIYKKIEEVNNRDDIPLKEAPELSTLEKEKKSHKINIYLKKEELNKKTKELNLRYRKKYGMRNNSDESFTYILGLDGGGVRGVYSARQLQFIEEGTKRKISDLFKGGITGVSTGSFIAAALAMPQHKCISGNHGKKDTWVEGPYSAEEVIQIYENLAPQVFDQSCAGSQCCQRFKSPQDWCSGDSCCEKTGSLMKTLMSCWGCFGCFKNCGGVCGPKYNNIPLINQLRAYFGNIKLGETIVPIQVIAFNITKNETKYFNSYDDPEIKIADALLASSAAPTYLPSAQIDEDFYIDGGVSNNKPATACLEFAQKHRKSLGLEIEAQRLCDYILVSVGTGESSPLFSHPEKAGTEGLLFWGKSIPNILISAQSQSDDATLKKLYALFDSEKNYIRIQDKIPENIEYDMDNPKLITYMKRLAEVGTEKLKTELRSEMLGKEKLQNTQPLLRNDIQKLIKKLKSGLKEELEDKQKSPKNEIELMISDNKEEIPVKKNLTLEMLPPKMSNRQESYY